MKPKQLSRVVGHVEPEITKAVEDKAARDNRSVSATVETLLKDGLSASNDVGVPVFDRKYVLTVRQFVDFLKAIGMHRNETAEKAAKISAQSKLPADFTQEMIGY